MADDRTRKRWAVVRIVLGNLQMAGAVASIVLLLRLGACTASLIAISITGSLLLASVYLFRVLRYDI